MSKLIKCKTCDSEMAADAKACPKCGAANKKKGGCLKLALGGFALLLFLMVMAGRSGESDSSGASSSASSSSGAQQLNMPASQTQFLEIVQKAQRSSRSAANDMARGGALNERNNALHKLPTHVTGWVGKVKTVNSNSEGKGVLSIELAEGVYVQTWNNAISDINSNTLLDPSTELFNKAAALKRRQTVRFSGSFLRDEETGFNEQSLSLSGKLNEPEFTFKFESIEGL